MSLLALITVFPFEVMLMSPVAEIRDDPVIVVSPSVPLIPELMVKFPLERMFDATAVELLVLELVLVPSIERRRSA